MLSSVIRRLRLSAAARQYARQLPTQIRRDCGWSEFYCSPQIDKSVARAALPLRYIDLGYALFLDEPTFDERRGARLPQSYGELRALLNRYAPKHLSAGFEAAAENSDAKSGAGEVTHSSS